MTTGQSTIIGDATVAASGIARMANVGRAAVSNWRRRYADFPVPVGGTPTSPLFDAREVEQWLRRQGKLHQAGTEQWAWRHIEGSQPAAQMADALGIAGAYLLVRSTQPARSEAGLLTPRQLLTGLRALNRGLANAVNGVLPKQWTPQLTTVLHAVDQLSREQDPESAFEYLHGQYVTSAHSLSGLATTPDTVATVMLTLAGTGDRTFDFTSGTGSILRMAADQALHKGVITECHAQEINPQYALITLLRLEFVRQRASAAGHDPAPPTVHVGDSLLADAFPDLRADVVVANFPFGIHDWGHEHLAYDPRWTYGLPPRTEPELAWVQHALAHLSTGGTAVVLMPPAAALRPAGRRIRAELVRRGALRAVIALPPGLMPPAAIGLHIWVLTRPDPQQPQAGRLLFVDSTASKDSSLPDIVARAWQSYLSGHDTQEAGLYRTIPAIEVLDEQVDLTPWRYLPQGEHLATDPAQTLAKINDFDRLVAQVRRSLPTVRKTKTAALLKAPQASLADLIRAGGMSIQRASSRVRPGDAPDHAVVLSSADILAGRPPTGSATRANADPAPRVHPGDILIPIIGREIVARVAIPEHVGAELGPGVQLLRVDPARFDPWFVAGILSPSDNVHLTGRASSASSGSLRIDVRRLTVPVLPLDQQQAYGRAFRQLTEFRARLNQAAATGAALAQEIRDGLTRGSLTTSPSSK